MSIVLKLRRLSYEPPMPPSSPALSWLPALALVLGLALAAGPPALAAPDPAAAAAIFAEARSICDRDAGHLWGRTLCGPILLVDPNDRAIVASHADAGGAVKADGPVFTGTLPASEILANTPIEWSGRRWTELMWPLHHFGDGDGYDETAKRRVMLAHELFHRIQPDLKLTRPEGGNWHLDSFEGRYLLQLEWRALARALQAKSAKARRGAIADALLFRHERYRLFPQAAAEEASLEINEGVPEYTGVRLGLTTPQERVRYAVYDLSVFVTTPSFVRSFAYATGPAYGLLLDQADPKWRGKLGSGRGLDQLLGAALRLAEPAPARLEAREAAYDDGTLRASEQTRDTARRARLAALKARLVDGPVLTLSMSHANYQFNPQTLQPLDAFGIVYPTLRLSGAWGVLEVDGGALVDKDMTVATVSAAGAEPPYLKGDGWRLSLNSGWTVQPGARKGDLAVKPAEGAGH